MQPLVAPGIVNRQELLMQVMSSRANSHSTVHRAVPISVSLTLGHTVAVKATAVG